MKKFKEIFNIQTYRGINDHITNSTYNGSDNGLGVFSTDNLTMAKWFANMVEYSPEKGEYIDVPDSKGRIIEEKIDLDSSYIIDESNEFYDIDNGIDSFQIYIEEIDLLGGVKNYKEYLLNNCYDSVVLKGCKTNYYEEGTYTIFIDLKK